MIFDKEPSDWQELQTFVGQIFQECGFDTEVSRVVELARGKKEVDVYTQDNGSEYKPIVLIECKFWDKPVNQETVHSFRTVVADYGANFGFIVSRNGFQAGCYEAAKNTNVKLVSLDELQIEYYNKWIQGMISRYLPLADELFPYWDYPGKIPKDGGTIDFEKQQLIYSAYYPICSLGKWNLMKDEFKRSFPIILPVINDQLQQIGVEEINTERQYFDFIEKNKDRAINHFKSLYRE